MVAINLLVRYFASSPTENLPPKDNHPPAVRDGAAPSLLQVGMRILAEETNPFQCDIYYRNLQALQAELNLLLSHHHHLLLHIIPPDPPPRCS